MEITGRITENAVIKTIKNDDRKVVNFSIADNYRYKSKDSQQIVQQTVFYNCSYWISTKLATYLTKGTLVKLTGQLTVNAWIDLQGEARASLNFHVDRIQFLSKSGQLDHPTTIPANLQNEDLPF